jgi:hypothetical protein
MAIYRIEIDLDALGWSSELQAPAPNREYREEQLQASEQVLLRVASILEHLAEEVRAPKTHYGHNVSASLQAARRGVRHGGRWDEEDETLEVDR